MADNLANQKDVVTLWYTSSMNKNVSKEKIYEEVGRNYRFFLNWRHLAFAGYLAVLYTIISLTIAFINNLPSIAWFVPAFSSLIGITFWLIDKRIQDLYHDATEAGTNLEGEYIGFYKMTNTNSDNKKNRNKKINIPHSTVLKYFYLGTSFILFQTAIVLLLLNHPMINNQQFIKHYPYSRNLRFNY